MLPVSAVLATPMSTSNWVCVVTYSIARERARLRSDSPGTYP